MPDTAILTGPPCWPRKPEFGGAGAMLFPRDLRDSTRPGEGLTTFKRKGA
ncbi:hypothetical protein MASR2M74_24980 [Paracoccaceae bacterium]